MLVALRQELCVALRTLPGCYSYVTTELCININQKKISFSLMWKEQRYQLWAVLWVWPALPTLLSWAISFYDPLTCGPGDMARGARLLSLKTNSWYVALALLSSASTAHSKTFITETIAHLAFQSTHRGEKRVTIPSLLWCTRAYIGADVRDGGVDSWSLSALLTFSAFGKHEIYRPYRRNLSGLVWSVLYSGIGCQCFITSIQKLSDCWEV